MSIKSVAKAVGLLKSALCDVKFCGQRSGNDQKTDRESELLILSHIPQLFDQCPELSYLSVDINMLREPDGEGGVSTSCSADPRFHFSFEEDGEHFEIETTTTDGSDIRMELENIVEELCDGDVQSELAGRIEERRVRMEEMCRRYENHVRQELEDEGFWARSGKRSLAISREGYEKSLIGGVLDGDALRANQRFDDMSVSGRQANLAAAPAYWNRAVIATLANRLKAGMDPDATDDNGVTALVAATVYGRTADVQVLLDAGADPNLVDGNGMTPVAAAVAVGHAVHAELLRLLVDSGANPDGTRVVPSLLVAVAANEGDAMIRTLTGVGADVQATMPNGKPFVETFQTYLDGANGATRLAVTTLGHSLATEQAVQDALGPDANASAGSKRRERGLSL